MEKYLIENLRDTLLGVRVARDYAIKVNERNLNNFDETSETAILNCIGTLNYYKDVLKETIDKLEREEWD